LREPSTQVISVPHYTAQISTKKRNSNLYLGTWKAHDSVQRKATISDNITVE